MQKKIVDRRGLLRTGLVMGGLLAGTASGSGAVLARTTTPPHGSTPGSPPTTPEEAWATLREGNRRWVAGAASHPRQDLARRAEVAQKQTPFAAVFSCIDSRVPPELVFDTGLGDLMVTRTAGHTLNRLINGSLQYGPAELGIPLMVVLGHQRCGAVSAAAEALHEGRTLPGDLQRIVSSLRSAYRRSGGDVDTMIRVHTVDVVGQLKQDELLRPLLAEGRLKVIGAYYSLDTGEVTRLV